MKYKELVLSRENFSVSKTAKATDKSRKSPIYIKIQKLWEKEMKDVLDDMQVSSQIAKNVHYKSNSFKSLTARQIAEACGMTGNIRNVQRVLQQRKYL